MRRRKRWSSPNPKTKFHLPSVSGGAPSRDESKMQGGSDVRKDGKDIKEYLR